MRPGNLLFWDGTAFLAILLAPSQWRLGQPFWTLPAIQELQVWVWGATFLAFALCFSLATRRAPVGVLTAVLVAAACWGSGLAFLAFQPDIQYSRLIAAFSGTLGFLLAVLPFLLGRRQVPGAVLLAATTLAVGWLGVRYDAVAPRS